MNAPLPRDIAAFMAAAADEFRAAMADAPAWWADQPLPDDMTRERYEREQIASANALRPVDEPADDIG